MRIQLIEFYQELRTTKTPQCRGEIAIKKTKERCSLGIFCDMLQSAQPDNYKYKHIAWMPGGEDESLLLYNNEIAVSYTRLGELLEIPYSQVSAIYCLNDGSETGKGASFKEVAQMIYDDILTQEEREFLQTLKKELKNGTGHEIRKSRSEEGYTKEGAPLHTKSSRFAK